jgi:hypothetical protein
LFYNLDAPRVALQKGDMPCATAQRFDSYIPRTGTKVEKIRVNNLFSQNTEDRFFNAISSRADDTIALRCDQASPSECASDNSHF